MDETDNAPDEPDTAQEAAPASAAVNRRLIDDWFFNHFNQFDIVSHPRAFALARAAKEDLIRLLGLT